MMEHILIYYILHSGTVVSADAGVSSEWVVLVGYLLNLLVYFQHMEIIKFLIMFDDHYMACLLQGGS